MKWKALNPFVWLDIYDLLTWVVYVCAREHACTCARARVCVLFNAVHVPVESINLPIH